MKNSFQKLKQNQQGYTLVELMISIVLGLIIVAAGIQLFITGITSYKLQKAMANIQNNASFGLNFIIDDIRKANLSSPLPAVNDQISYAGILLTDLNVGKKINLNCNDCFKDNKLSTFGTAHVAAHSNDQLIIRYRAPHNSFDCSGIHLTKDTFVIQRYYVGPSSTDLRQSLRCQAAQYTQQQLNALKETDAALKLNWKNSQIILPNVDFFKVKLGYIDGDLNKNDSSLAYVDVENYMNLTAKKKNINGIVQITRPHINSIQLGVLVQSQDNAGNHMSIRNKNKDEFQMLGMKLKLNAAYQDARLRQVVEQTVSLRNAMGWVAEGCDSSKTTTCTGGL